MPKAYGLPEGVFSSGALAGFEIIKVLVESRTSTIFLARWKRHNMLVVLKVYASHKLSRSQTSAAWQEAQLPVLLTSCGVPNICKVHWAFQQHGVIVVVQQYCEQGNLSQMLTQRGCALSERETCCMLVVPLLVTLWHLAQHCILHADIKLENIFVSNRKVYLGDFGASQRLFKPLKSLMGTVDFMAPEILRVPRRQNFVHEALYRAALENAEGFGLPVDVWAFGVTVYEALCGCRPWFSSDKAGTIADILAFRMHEFPPSISPAARSFVLAALTHDANLRPTPQELLAHPWVTSYVTSVTSVLSMNSCSSAEELASEVVKVTGSSETAVSMLRSIGSLQMADRSKDASVSSQTAASGGSGPSNPAPLPASHQEVTPTVNPFAAPPPLLPLNTPETLHCLPPHPPVRAFPGSAPGHIMPAQHLRPEPAPQQPFFSAPYNPLDRPQQRWDAQSLMALTSAASRHIAHGPSGSAQALALDPLNCPPSHRSRTLMPAGDSWNSGGANSQLGRASSAASLRGLGVHRGYNSSPANQILRRNSQRRGTTQSGCSTTCSSNAAGHYSGPRAGEFDGTILEGVEGARGSNGQSGGDSGAPDDASPRRDVLRYDSGISGRERARRLLQQNALAQGGPDGGQTHSDESVSMSRRGSHVTPRERRSGLMRLQDMAAVAARNSMDGPRPSGQPALAHASAPNAGRSGSASNNLHLLSSLLASADSGWAPQSRNELRLEQGSPSQPPSIQLVAREAAHDSLEPPQQERPEQQAPESSFAAGAGPSGAQQWAGGCAAPSGSAQLAERLQRLSIANREGPTPDPPWLRSARAVGQGGHDSSHRFMSLELPGMEPLQAVAEDGSHVQTCSVSGDEA